MTTVTSPLAGRAIGLAAVPDPVFSGAMVGPGTAIDPVREPSEAVSPVDGIVVSLHPHAFVVVDDQGHGVLTHLGIDTVQLNGEGFELLVNKGDTVTRGQARRALGPGRRRGRRQVGGLPGRGAGGHGRLPLRGPRGRRREGRRRALRLAVTPVAVSRTAR